MNESRKSKFYKPPTIKERLATVKYCFLFWKGRKKGMIHTRDIQWVDIRQIFFPKDFYEKYSYLGSIPYNDESKYFKAIYSLVLTMDYEAKPKWCPRWVLRFLDVFGNDSSIVRVRNRNLHNLFTKLTKGIRFVDYKTKWYHYDLRLYINAPEHLQDLADDIENGFYSRGKQEELIEAIKKLDPNASIIRGSVKQLEKHLEELESKQNDKVEA